MSTSRPVINSKSSGRLPRFGGFKTQTSEVLKTSEVLPIKMPDLERLVHAWRELQFALAPGIVVFAISRATRRPLKNKTNIDIFAV